MFNVHANGMKHNNIQKHNPHKLLHIISVVYRQGISRTWRSRNACISRTINSRNALSIRYI